MSPKETAKKSTAQKATETASKNGHAPSEHLEKANKAMAKAWALIASRKEKSA